MSPVHDAHRRRSTVLVAAILAIGSVSTVAADTAEAAGAPTASVFVSPAGAGSTCVAKAPCSLLNGQARARVLAAAGNNVVVTLAGGRYGLTSPLTMTAADSGVGAAIVTYRAAAGAAPVITGARTVSGWAPTALGDDVYSASTPVGLDTRQLYVNGQVAPRAQVVVPSSSLSLDATGITINDPQLAAVLDTVSAPSRVELEAVLSFTDRFSPVASISGNRLTMAQPAWDNNTYGYDVLQSPFRAPQFTLQNAPELLSAAGQWYIDPAVGKLYYRAAQGQDPSTLDVQLPTMESVLQVSGSLADPVRNLVFKGLTFTGTSWLRPSTSDGFASQQTGTYMTGADPNRPVDAFDSCRAGCAGFEATRGKWGMIAGGVQVSAAQNITFTGNTFTNLGSQALGIGNDGGANASGVDLAAQNIAVTGNRFSQVSGGAVIVGGSQADAHHPSDTRMANRSILIAGNVVTDVGLDYHDVAGIFATYVDGLTIDHNELANLPYTGVAVGFGWGGFDAGGSNEYANRGLYNYYPRYASDDPTTARDYHVTGNYIHDIVTRMNDAGCIYTLGSVPNSLIDANYCRDAGNGSLLYSWPVYLDEGSANFTVSNNVFLRVPAGLHSNYQNTYSNHDLVADTNFISANVANQDLTRVPGGSSTNLVAVTEPNLPIAASRIAFLAGTNGHAADPQRPPLGVELRSDRAALTPQQSLSLTATLANVDPKVRLSSIAASIGAPAGWTVTATSKQAKVLPVTGTLSPTWRITAPAVFASAAPQIITLTVTYLSGTTEFSTARTVTINPQSPVTSLSTYTNAAMTFAQFGSSFAITGSSSDTFDGFGIHSDSYGSVFQPAAAGANATVVARVDSYDKVSGGAKAGIVVRNDLTKPGAAKGYAAIMVQQEGVTVFNDADGNGFFEQFFVARNTPTTGPLYLRLVRSGGQLNGSWSTDGATWNQVGGAVALNSPATTLDAGMIWTTANPNTSGTASFDSFSVVNPTG